MIKTDTHVSIQFYHQQDGLERPFVAQTKCELINSVGEVISSGWSYCKRPDQFSRIEGRKRALARAVKAVNEDGVAIFSYPERCSIWEAYFARKGENPDYS